MDYYSIFFILAGLIFLINVIPWFAPPTWVLLLLFTAIFGLPPAPVILIGVSAATLGRVVLYQISSKYLFRFLSTKSRQNVSFLGKFLNSRRGLSIPMFLVYTLSPVSTSELFIAGGISHFSLSVLLVCFVIGRSVSYSFWVINSHSFAEHALHILKNDYSSILTLVPQILGILALYLFTKLHWKKILNCFSSES
jgi:hypothetical protein